MVSLARADKHTSRRTAAPTSDVDTSQNEAWQLLTQSSTDGRHESPASGVDASRPEATLVRVRVLKRREQLLEMPSTDGDGRSVEVEQINGAYDAQSEVLEPTPHDDACESVETQVEMEQAEKATSAELYRCSPKPSGFDPRMSFTYAMHSCILADRGMREFAASDDRLVGTTADRSVKFNTESPEVSVEPNAKLVNARQALECLCGCLGQLAVAPCLA